MSDTTQFLTVDEAAQKLGLTVQAIYTALRNRRFPGAKKDPATGRHKIPADAVHNYQPRKK